MAKATLRFIDLPDGRVRVKVAFDPPIDNSDDSEDYTPAQMAALMAMQKVGDHQTPPAPPAASAD
jgi:hypothetical protein